MSDAPFIISPAGFIADTNFSGFPQSGGKNAPWTVTQLLPGGIVSSVASGGNLALSGQLSGKQGSMQADILTGTSGSQQSVGLLTTGSASIYCGIIVNSSNGPGITLTDANGNNAFLASSSTSYASGVRLQVKVFWNSVSGSYQVFVNGALATSGTNAAWTSFVPSSLVFGNQALVGFNVFAGTVYKVQASNIGSP